MATAPNDVAPAVLAIAQRQALQDHERLRAELLRIRRDWGRVSPELKAKADLMMDAFDGFGLAVQQVTL